ncbi:cytidyltransferase [Alkalihalobacillus sp. MEB130]|uniref:cytidyltransferase n=1 Tax=Alkalihalobacillus sp. MEB130 TaxID=2976704 RepID=UPI0028E03BAB|nr:cytidyltransferase [Alkalihalobacillus sp. MEB130]MDT8861350.1 cytidyltransferase [Alkalihalobacillus sp. MEB130]
MEIEHIRYPDRPTFIKGNGCALALGFFDGFHIGHQQILETTKRLSEKQRLEFAVMTFFPHPSTVIPSDKVITKYLTPLPIKQQMFEQVGVEKVYLVHFNEAFATISHSNFVNDYLKGVNCKHAVAGFDFSYGYRGKGNMKQLIIDSDGDFEITTVAKVEENNNKISSTYIRELLMKGDVSRIPFYLGDYYKVRGNIVSYQQNQRKIKLMVDVNQDVFLPKPGTYKVSIKVGKTINLGTIMIPEDELGDIFIWVKMPNHLVIPKSICFQFLSREELLLVSNE